LPAGDRGASSTASYHLRVAWRRRIDDLRVERFVDGLIVFHRSSGALHHLDASAALVWDLLGHLETRDELVRAVADLTESSVGAISQDVSSLLGRFFEEGLLEVSCP
jgi:hypothetical protein